MKMAFIRQLTAVTVRQLQWHASILSLKQKCWWSLLTTHPADLKSRALYSVFSVMWP